uniref:ATP synthase complex subunit 8 n=2 Tax=Schedorhinotermes TaxID=127390 RepID=I6TJF9_9NEOP|nr:ATP synthase F0 subunit 8 [Schedorhinotermes breinli]AFM92464.1 ATP synthase F0 subunit 8 [Schedorhinotermes breinli]QAX91067.1 ATP synthase F0 subunit 8 [Schedorhinotermes sp. 7 MW-2019]QAX91093.1 ATP synthase F0 subunit 8 [Schedorhinotermes breinli]
MPQMMPMEWTMLYTMFLATFLVFNITIYYMTSTKSKKSSKSAINQTPLNWKW